MSNYCDKGHWEAGLTLPCRQCEIESLRQQLASRDAEIAELREQVQLLRDAIRGLLDAQNLRLDDDDLSTETREAMETLAATEPKK